MTRRYIDEDTLSPSKSITPGVDDLPEEDNLTSSEGQERRGAAVGDEMVDSVISGEGYSIRGDLTEDVLTEGSPARRPDLYEEDSDLAGVLASKERATLADDNTTEESDIEGESQPEST